jgi:uncharacterized protein
MSQQNVEVIRRLYAAMRARDASAVVDSVDPEAEWIPDSRVGEAPVRGRESVFAFFRDRSAVFREVEIEIERLLEQDDRVLAFVRMAGRGAASGAAFEIRIAHLSTLRDGIVVRGQGYGDRDEALEAFGLSRENASRETVDRVPPEPDLRWEDVMRRRLG